MKINVLVTAVGGRSVGFHVMRSLLLEPNKFNVFVTDMNPNAAGLYYSNKGFLVPPCNDENYLNVINEIIHKNEIDIIIPGSEPELYMLSDKREHIETKLLINPKETVDRCRDKSILYKWLSNNNYTIPKTMSYEELRFADIDSIQYPLVVKPIHKTGGSRGVKILANTRELFNYAYNNETNDVVFQEYVGTPYDEYTVGVIVYNDKVTTDSIIMHRIIDDISLLEKRNIEGKEYAISTGLSQVITLRAGFIRTFCENLCKDIGIIGPGNIQFRLTYDDYRGPIFNIFEVHPRFSGTSFMRASVGFNDSASLVLNFVNGEIPDRMEYEFNSILLKFLDHVIVHSGEYL